MKLPDDESFEAFFLQTVIYFSVKTENSKITYLFNTNIEMGTNVI